MGHAALWSWTTSLSLWSLSRTCRSPRLRWSVEVACLYLHASQAAALTVHGAHEVAYEVNFHCSL